MVREHSGEKPRCWWAEGGDPLYRSYHDEEWGVPLHDDRKLFEMLLLEGFQAGLSWITILRKRENFRKAFREFDPEVIVRFKKRDLDRLMRDAGIVRNRLKIEGSVRNAGAFLAAREEFGSFDKFIWQFTEGKTLRKPGGLTRELIVAKTPESDLMSKELARRGFKFVGSTICYAFMQAVGMVDDHTVDCFRHGRLGGLVRAPLSRTRLRPAAPGTTARQHG
jgi:DNA-3-methyladenine glycosylase I